MMELRLHGALWRSASPQRREEWQRCLEEFNAANEASSESAAGGEEPSLELVRLPSRSFQVRVYRDSFERVAQADLDQEALKPLIDDYATTIRQMVHVDRDAPARGFESLDYAKRVVHDEAAAYVRDALAPEIELGERDARLLFTLIFLIAGDLPEAWVRYHRIHGA